MTAAPAPAEGPAINAPPATHHDLS